MIRLDVQQGTSIICHHCKVESIPVGGAQAVISHMIECQPRGLDFFLKYMTNGEGHP